MTTDRSSRINKQAPAWLYKQKKKLRETSSRDYITLAHRKHFHGAPPLPLLLFINETPLSHTSGVIVYSIYFTRTFVPTPSPCKMRHIQTNFRWLHSSAVAVQQQQCYTFIYVYGCDRIVRVTVFPEQTFNIF